MLGQGQYRTIKKFCQGLITCCLTVIPSFLESSGAWKVIFDVFLFAWIQDVLAAPASAEEGEVPSALLKPAFLTIVDMANDLIIPFQGNKYKQCILIAGNMAKWLQRTSVLIICQVATTGENHPIGAGSGTGTLQQGETVSLHRPKSVPKQQERTLMFKHLWGLFVFAVWELIFWYGLSRLLDCQQDS